MINSDFHGECCAFNAADLFKGLICDAQLAALPDHLNIDGVAPLSDATQSQLSFLDNHRYRSQLAQTNAGLVIVAERHMEQVPSHTQAVYAQDVYTTFAQAVLRLYPRNIYRSFTSDQPITAGSFVDSSAQLEDRVEIGHAAFIGANAQIGSGTFIGQHSTIGRHVTIGRNSYIMPGVTIECAHIGDNVVIHSGARIGQDGFGFAMSPNGHTRVLQLGAVIIQDDVDIGANSTVDRGTLRDTIIGQGSKIDNQVQIGHNVHIGRHCVLSGQVGISGSTTLGDFVVMGGKVGVIGHIEVRSGTQVAAASNVSKSTQPGVVIGGTPAKEMKMWLRELAALSLLGKKSVRK